MDGIFYICFVIFKQNYVVNNTIYILIQQIITLVDDDDIISRASFDKYLTNDFLPYVKSFYDVSVKAYTALDEIFLLLLQAIATLKLKKNEVISVPERFT